jgi:hypothetical protein
MVTPDLPPSDKFYPWLISRIDALRKLDDLSIVAFEREAGVGRGALTRLLDGLGVSYDALAVLTAYVKKREAEIEAAGGHLAVQN